MTVQGQLCEPLALPAHLKYEKERVPSMPSLSHCGFHFPVCDVVREQLARVPPPGGGDLF